MRWVEEDVRKLEEKLTALSRGGGGGRLTPKSVNITLTALRGCRGRLISPLTTEAIVSFQIETLDGMGLPGEVLAINVDERVARTAFAKAKTQFPDQKIMVWGKTSSGKRVHPAI
ncbi:hypothetical protein [Methylocapsa sp. S129]|uniref:hypothetical protein n=1 Tax=Methylocapsa sp. S129 TaxID=1641869 RepID=UPI00131C05FC|nr:hypothetical protein [Methylocapsa sp. S129]